MTKRERKVLEEVVVDLSEIANILPAWRTKTTELVLKVQARIERLIALHGTEQQ